MRGFCGGEGYENSVNGRKLKTQKLKIMNPAIREINSKTFVSKVNQVSNIKMFLAIESIMVIEIKVTVVEIENTTAIVVEKEIFLAVMNEIEITTVATVEDNILLVVITGIKVMMVKGIEIIPRLVAHMIRICKSQ